MDAHSRDGNMLHKCNRARRENVASDILYILGYKIQECINQAI